MNPIPKGPMLAEKCVTEVDLAAAGKKNLLQFPLAAEVKHDGFRCVMLNGTSMMRSLKPLKNMFARNRLETCFGSPSVDVPVHPADHPFNGFDGELIALDPETLEEQPLNVSQSRFNSRDGNPRFVFHIFDDFSDPTVDYMRRKDRMFERVERIRSYVSNTEFQTNPNPRFKRIPDHVFQATEYRICKRIEDVLEFEAEVLEWGGEGIMLKSLNGHYKSGRSTVKEGLCLKLKRFEDDEGEIIGYTELMINANELETDERGFAKRSDRADGKIPGNTLGTIICRWRDVEFEIGTFLGWTDWDRQEIWDNRSGYLGKKIGFKYKGIGPNGKPLIPSGQGIRYDV